MIRFGPTNQRPAMPAKQPRHCCRQRVQPPDQPDNARAPQGHL